MKVVSDLAISAQKYLKIVTEEENKFQEIRNTAFQNYILFFLRHFDVVFHMFMVLRNTFNRYKNCNLDKTAEGNVVSELAISPQKYPKICTQGKEKCQGICKPVFQNYVAFLRSFDVVFHMFQCINQTFHQNKTKM